VTIGNALDLVNAPDVSSIAALIADDGGDGISLREAITAANNTAGADTITFDPSVFTGGSASLIRLAGTELVVDGSLTIDGLTGTDVVITADANNDDVTVGTSNITDVVNNSSTSDNSRVFSIGAGETTLRGLTITGGFDGSGGGGIRSTSAGILTLDQSTVSGNATLGAGGGINVLNGTTTIISSTISGNSADDDGGGIFSSTNLTDQTTTITSSTISGNTATNGQGGGIFNLRGLTVIQHSTITANTASTGQGSGVTSRGDNDVRTEVAHSIIAGNTNEDVAVTDNVNNNSFQSNGFNLIGTGDTSSGAPIVLARFNQFGDQRGVANPLLGPLADNGGPTLTHSLLPGSLALNAGDPAAVAGVGNVPLFEQRESGFDRVVGGRIDIGAVEEQLAETVSLIVTTNSDVVDGFDFETSLREAILLANNTAGADTITFDASVFTGGSASLIRLAGTELVVSDSLTIDGLTGIDVVITADANDDDITVGTTDITDALNNSNRADNSRVFSIGAGETTLRGLTITGGFDGNSGGGGIRSTSAGILTIEQSTVSGNFAFSSGGGILAFYGTTITITSSTISGNSANGGGGIFALGGTMMITSSTVSGNSARSYGGGIFAFSDTTTITSSTISGNSADRGGGGVYADGVLTISSSTISGNSAGEDGGGILTLSSFRGQPTTITNSTISGNTTTGGRGGGIFNRLGLTVIQYSTITANTASTGRGSGVASSGSNYFTARTEVTHSIIAGNTNEDIAVTDNTSNNSFQSNGFNLIGTAGGAFDVLDNFTAIGDQTGITNPMLGPLADNGGPTLTHALLPGSPAIDAGDPAVVAGVGNTPVSDQRGSGRVDQGRIDIGSFEVQVAPTADIVDVAPDPRNTTVGNVTVNFDEAVSNVDITDFTLTRDGQTVDISGLTVSQNNPQQYEIDLSTVTDADGDYELTLLQGSDIIDGSGNGLSSDAIDQFMIDTVGPQVESVVVNDGDAQRSVVTEITVNFSEIVVVDASSFVLTNTTTNTQIVPTVTTSTIDGKTVAKLTFNGAGIIGGSLADGDYTLTTLDSVLDSAGNQLDGDNDGDAGGSATDDFFRLFGDANGDRTVNMVDFFQFRNAFSGGPYNAAFDYNGDGLINISDFFQFRSGFGTSL